MTNISPEELKKMPPEVVKALGRGMGFAYPLDVPVVLTIPEGAKIEISSPKITLRPLDPTPHERHDNKLSDSLKPISYIVEITGSREVGVVKVCTQYDFGPLCAYVVIFALITVLVPVY